MISGINELYHLKQSNPAKALDAVSQQFEAIFAHQLMKVMGDSIPKGGLFEEGLASDMFKDMLFQNIGQALAETGSLGIGRMMRDHVQALSSVKGNSGETVPNR